VIAGATVSAALRYAREHAARFTDELAELVRIPSVGSSPRHASDVHRCARWLAQHIARLGLGGVRMIEAGGHPIVVGESPRKPGRPTLLVYGHYDVQPAEPLAPWSLPPFGAVIRGTDLYGRGSSDDKGQFFAHLKAIESWQKTSALPLNVRVVLEGEEETGSRTLLRRLGTHPSEFACDAAVISDMTMPAHGRPALTIGLRGAINLELQVAGAAAELHSGNFGGAVANPLQALCEMVAAIHGPDGRVRIPGFYQDVRSPSPRESASFSATGRSDVDFLRDAGAKVPWGERGFSLEERVTIRPALTVAGISGVYAGPGVKAVIPARATAKINVRIVPDQEPRFIAEAVSRFFAARTPPGITSHLRVLSTAAPAVVNPASPAALAARRALERGFGREAALQRVGGTIPIVSELQRLGTVPLLMGFARPADRIHAADERMHLPHFHRGIAASIWLLNELSGIAMPSRHARAGTSLIGGRHVPVA
jgi:acetylornithine deacetylase/succinyl-diaminopimelate desuccinylase-like protein